MNAVSSTQSAIQSGSRWTIADAMKIHTDDPTTTMPVIDYAFPVIDSDVWQWDTWLLRDIHGKTVTFKGWYVMFALVADRSATGDTVEGWHSRNNYSYIGYYYSRTGNGADWKFGGRVIKEGANSRSWEWSGCAVMRENSGSTVDLFYTSVNDTPSESVPSYTTGRILADANGVWFEGFDVCTDMFQADGVNYANIVEDQYWDFRDPHIFRNPDDNQIYALFEGNVPGMRGDFTIGSDEMGFVSRNGIFGPYAPLNGSGLVLGNPSSAPYETYSHFVDPAGYVQSFIDTLPQPGSADPQNPETYRIGGTLAPTVKIVLDGERTFLTEVHAYGQVYAQGVWPTSSAWDKRS